jgi:uncharacterized membrane protein
MKTTPRSPLQRVLFSPGAALALAAVAGPLALGAPAFADLKLCNTTASRVGVALGYSDASGGWTTEGWWTLPAQTCETLYKGQLSSRYWYVHAVDYDSGGEWAGQSFMCTYDKAFTIKGVQECTKRGYNRTGFFEVDTQGAKDWTIRLTDPSEGGAKAK